MEKVALPLASGCCSARLALSAWSDVADVNVFLLRVYEDPDDSMERNVPGEIEGFTVYGKTR